jgi:site-specific DNA-methyltransferase (adenine-specific)
MEVVNVDIKLVKPYNRNPRKNQPIDKVAESLKQFGFRQPIVVDKDYIVIVGHTRLLAAKKLGFTEVPIHIADLTEEQAKQYRLADNRTNQDAQWDDKLLYSELKELPDLFTGFDQKEIDTIFAKNQEHPKDEDDIPDPSLNPEAKLGDIYKLGKHILICGDSTDSQVYDKLFGKEKIDLVITDPPYNVNYNPNMNAKQKGKAIANDNLSDQQFQSFLNNVFLQTSKRMKSGAPIYVFHADIERKAFQHALDTNNIKLTVSLVWVKNKMVFGRADYQSIHEPILYGWKEGSSHYFTDDRTNVTVLEDIQDFTKMTKDELVKLLTDIKTTIIRHDKPSKSPLHPTTKPVALIQELMENSSKPDDIVFDAFGGSGSTLIAAENCNRQCRMIELEPNYIDTIVKRWEEYTNKKAILC